jgi:hypothetical protein
MTSVRMSFVFAPEKEFKKGKSLNKWIAPPPGSYFSSTASRQTSPIYSTGSKMWDTTAYGQYAGSWDWTFMLDYQYLEPLVLAFDGVSINDGNEIKWEYKSEEGYGYNAYIGSESDHNDFLFLKMNDSKPPSFTVRRKILHRIVGGPTDEMVELKGCVVNSISFSRSSSTSQYQVQMSGFYATEEMVLGELGETDYKKYDGQLVEYSCVLLTDRNYDRTPVGVEKYAVTNTDSVSVTISNGTTPVYNTCTPFAGQYYEDRVKFQISTSCYSTDPETYKTRMYSGGYDKTARKPLSKGSKPLSEMRIVTFDSEISSDYFDSAADAIIDAFTKSKNRLEFCAEELVIKSARWVNGDGSKLTDSISSTDCKNIYLRISRECKGGQPDKLFKNIISDSPDPVTPADSST